MKRLFIFLLVFLSFEGISNVLASETSTYQMTDEEKKAEIAKAAEYQNYLVNLFTDFSCSELKDGITAGNLSSNSNYQQLSPSLQKMVDKIAKKDWSEDYSDKNLKSTYPNLYEDSWAHEYAVKYRVQDYEPYSESVASELVGVSRYTNMNNPTGIVGDKGNLIYIMVKDAVPTGATLYINEVWDPATMYNTATAGTQLKQGLNIIECKNNNSHFFIYYCVQTVKQTNGKYVADETHNLKNYKPITIHIEGGRLNGFFNYVGDTRYLGDTQKDFEYTVQRATHPMYNLIGKYVILHFHLEDSPAVVGEEKLYPCVKTVLFKNKGADPTREYDPVKILSAWDKMCLTERILMGLQSDAEVRDDYNQGLYEPNSEPCEITAGGKKYKASSGFQYNEYFNNKLFGMSRQSEGLFMSAGDWRTSYNVYTIEAVLTQFTQGDIWGPAHEYGHMNQRLINLAGTTEESNNIFSNVVVYYQGKNTSRSDFISNQFKIFQEGKPFLENGTWGTTRMFWQLWCYYHATGHNKKFYPRLFELLRNYPIQKTIRPGKHNELYDKLQFVRMCCIAAEEDLTDFFTAWGFFVPLELYSFADYNTYDTYLTEADIQAVKDEIKSYGFQKNDAIIFIDDRINSQRVSYDGFKKEDAGDFGGFDAFNTDRAPSGTFGYSVDINTVTIITDGDPGAGFIIKDKDGNLLGFSNSKTFQVSEDLADKLRSGEAIMQAVGADKTTETVTNLILDGGINDKKAILQRLVVSAKNLLNYVDESETKVGYLKKNSVSELVSLLNKIDVAMNEENTDSKTFSTLIVNLTDEFNRITNNNDSFIPLEMGNLYMLSNFARNTGQALTFNSNGICSTATKPKDPGAAAAVNFQWNFMPAIEEDTYYIQNWGNKAYIWKAEGSSQTLQLKYSGGYQYNVKSAREKDSKIGLFVMTPIDNTNLAIHVGGNGSVVGWTSDADASKWYITKVVDSSNVDMTNNYKKLLEGLIGQYNEYKVNIDPEGVYVGYLRPEASEVFDAHCKIISDMLEKDDCENDELAAFYNNQLQIFKNVTKSTELIIDVEPGAGYVLQNVFTDKENPLRYLSGEGDYVSTNPVASAETFARQWVFEGTDDPKIFALRNMNPSGKGKYVGNSLDGKQRLPMSEVPVYFKLNPAEDKIGEFGLSVNGDISHSLITLMLEAPNETNVVSRMASLSFMTGDEGKWKIKKVHDRDYVELRENLQILIDKANELYFNEDYWTFFDAWWETYQLLDAVSGASSPYSNPSTTLEEYKDWVEKFEGNLAIADALLGGDEIIYINSMGGANDCVDNNETESQEIIRHAFNISSSISFPGLFSIEGLDDPSVISVEITPSSSGQWVNSQAADKDALMREYQNIFTRTAPGSGLYQQLQSLECDFVDGFYTGVSGKLLHDNDEGFTLVVNAPCSGLYEVVLKGKEGYAIFTDDKKIPTYIVEIYPNLNGIFNKDKGFNINGYTFADDEEHDKTIKLPKEYVLETDLGNAIIYIPGLYFVDEFMARLDDESNKEEYIGLQEKNVVSTTSNPGASKYCAKIDLTSLKDMDEYSSPKKLNVSVSKNGASSNFTFLVSVGQNGNVSTNVESIETIDGEEPVYYNLQGVRVINPQQGIYIRRIGNKTEKVII